MQVLLFSVISTTAGLTIPKTGEDVLDDAAETGVRSRRAPQHGDVASTLAASPTYTPPLAYSVGAQGAAAQAVALASLLQSTIEVDSGSLAEGAKLGNLEMDMTKADNSVVDLADMTAGEKCIAAGGSCTASSSCAKDEVTLIPNDCPFYGDAATYAFKTNGKRREKCCKSKSANKTETEKSNAGSTSKAGEVGGGGGATPAQLPPPSSKGTTPASAE